MLKQLSYSLLTSEELIKTASRLCHCVQEPNLEEILENRIHKTGEAADILSNALTESLSDVYAGRVQQADLHRDDAFQAFKYGVLSASFRSEDTVKEAGEVLVEVVRKHGFSLYNLGYIAQSEAMKNLLTELEHHTQEISRSGVADLLEEMVSANNDFNEVYHERIEDEENNETPQIVVSKNELSHQITLFLNHVELLQEDKEAGASELVEAINKTISEMMMEARIRQTSKK